MAGEGGSKNIVLRFGKRHIAKLHAAHGEKRGLGAYAPPKFIFKWCVLVYVLIKFCLKKFPKLQFFI